MEPDVYISKDGEDYLIQVSDDDVPQLRLNPQYRRMLDREQEPNKDVRNYVKERYNSAIQLMKNIEQRKQTTSESLPVVYVARRWRFSSSGSRSFEADGGKESAEEIGVHPSTVSRADRASTLTRRRACTGSATSSSEAVQGPVGEGGLPLLLLKRRDSRR